MPAPPVRRLCGQPGKARNDIGQRKVRGNLRPGGWTGPSDEGVAHRAERRCSEGEEGFVEAPEREFRAPGG
jgi:hypothetical protein